MTQNEIQIFSNPEFGEVRTAKSESGKAFFCLADLCKALELSQPSRVRERLKSNGLILIKVSKEVISHGVGTGISKEEEQIFVDEPNLYRCILKSRKKEAEKFQDWVCEEVLPKLRSDGVVMVDRGNESPEELMARALNAANEILAKREARIKEVEQTNTLLLEENQEQKEQIEELTVENKEQQGKIETLEADNQTKEQGNPNLNAESGVLQRSVAIRCNLYRYPTFKRTRLRVSSIT